MLEFLSGDDNNQDSSTSLSSKDCRYPSTTTKNVLPKQLRSVSRFLEHNLEQPLCVDILAEVAGTSVRTLQSHFKEFLGVTPMEHVKAVRFHSVRQTLLLGQAKAVSDVARQTGFNHLGRFSSEYKARFGESPKQTLKNAQTIMTSQF